MRLKSKAMLLSEERSSLVRSLLSGLVVTTYSLIV